MNFVKFSAGLAQRGRSRAMARILAGRPLAVVFSVALTAVLGGVVFTAVPASAVTGPGTCLDAYAGQTYDYGSTIQWNCDTSDRYQQWVWNVVGNSSLGQLVQLQSVGDAGFCADADAQQTYDYGAVIQWGCNTNDPYQLWAWQVTPNGYSLQSYGAYLNGASECLDANSQEPFDYGAIIQWDCNSSDAFQLWNVESVSSNTVVLQNTGT